MPGTQITTSPNIAVFNSKIFANTCLGNFYIDATNSTWIGSGASSVLGVKVQIKNPYGVVIKPFGTSYDIPPPISSIYTFAIPTQAGKQQYGTYEISLQLTDAGGQLYYVTKTVNVCSYDKVKDNCENYLSLVADCKNGTLTIMVADPEPLKGITYQSRTLSIDVQYPTASTIPPISGATVPSFSVALYEGVYIVDVDFCATYNLGDAVSIALGKSIHQEKNVKCALDYSCIFPRIEQISDNLRSDCSEREKQKNSSIIIDALRLITTANLAVSAGADPSEYISELENLLGCSCTCDCSNLPIINNSPSTNVAIQGCNVGKTTVGLTDVYTIENYAYLVTVNPAQNYISISDPSIDGCTYTQQIEFNIQNVYQGIKTQIGDSTEYQYWASVINNTLSGINPICFGINQTQWNNLSFRDKFALLVSTSCQGGTCSASVSGVNVTQQGAAALISFTQTNGYQASVYVDGVLVGSVLAGVNQLLIPNGADGNNHTFLIIPQCSNGSNGASQSGEFAFSGCPSISPPSLSQSVVNNATCPYDLISLEAAPPSGITIEWHNANNTNPSSLVGNPEAVTSGVFYAFAKDANGCYSTSSQVTLTCQESASCSAPQSLFVGRIGGAIGGFNRIEFSSAAFPPPANSYTVKRKLASAPDVDGSYTTIGTPTYNVGLGKWTIADTSASSNVLYTYKAISNCSSSSPAVLFNYATILCPSNTLTKTTDTVGYSFLSGGGDISKFEVRLYNASGVTQLQIQTINPSFPSPITGSFTGLTSNTTYLVEITAFIGDYYTTCSKISVTTDSEGSSGIVNIDNQSSDGVIEGISPDPFDLPGGSFPLSSGVDVSGTHTGFTSAISVTISGSISGSCLKLLVGGATISSLGVSAAGVYNFPSTTVGSTDEVDIVLSNGACT